MAIRYDIEKHAVGFPAKCLATQGGAHIFNITAAEDTDNGWFVGKGAFVELDNYAEAAAGTATGTILCEADGDKWYVEIVTAEDAYFVSTVPMIEETYAKKFTNEANFFNAAGSVMRCYEVKPGDVVEISKSGFGTTPTKGASVSLAAVGGTTTMAKRFA